MSSLSQYDITLNIRYDLPDTLWAKIPSLYEQLPGWLGSDEHGIPYWFGKNENEKMIYASVEPAGLQIVATIEADEWLLWLENFKRLATGILGFEVRDVADAI